MLRTALGLALALVCGCGGDVDDRPREFEYIVRTVFQPNCGAAQCHSTFSQSGRRPQMDGDPVIPIVLDSVAGARTSFALDEALLDHFGPDADQTPTLIVNLTEEYATAPRMPYDDPLPAGDLALISDWIELGGPGLCASGAAAMCHGKKEYHCDPATRALTTLTGRACK
jgi:hypothetical protein